MVESHGIIVEISNTKKKLSQITTKKCIKKAIYDHFHAWKMWINNHLAWNLLTNTCIRIRIHTRNHKTNIEIFFLFLFTDYFKAIRLNGVPRLHFFLAKWGRACIFIVSITMLNIWYKVYYGLSYCISYWLAWIAFHFTTFAFVHL